MLDPKYHMYLKSSACDTFSIACGQTSLGGSNNLCILMTVMEEERQGVSICLPQNTLSGMKFESCIQMLSLPSVSCVGFICRAVLARCEHLIRELPL